MYGYQKAERRPIRILPLFIGLLGAIMVGFALTVQVRSWGALGSEAGGSCGTYRGPCPRGTGWMIPVSIVSLVVLVPLTVAGMLRSGTRGIGWIIALVVMVAGVFPGLKVFTWAHGATLQTVWATPSERPVGVSALGSWQSGSMVMRARFDQVDAYDVATGNKTWTYAIPSPEVLCSMSRTVEGGIGLVGHGAENKPCTHVTAVDLDNGHALWTKELPPTDVASTVTADVVAVSKETAVTQTRQTITGYTPREGAQRWQQKAGDRCYFNKIIAGGDQVLADVGCINQPPRVRAIDAVTGKTRWETSIPIQSTSANLTMLSAAPAVVFVAEGGQRGVNAVMIFDRTGRALAPIQRDDGQTRLDISQHGFSAAPVRNFFVQDGLLILRAASSGNQELMIAYGLTDGRERWVTQVADTRAIQAEPGRIVYLDDRTISPGLRSVSLQDGKTTYLGVTGFRWVTSDMALYLVGGEYAFVSERANTPDTHPLAVVKTK